MVIIVQHRDREDHGLSMEYDNQQIHAANGQRFIQTEVQKIGTSEKPLLIMFPLALEYSLTVCLCA